MNGCEQNYCWQLDCKHCQADIPTLNPFCELPFIQCSPVGQCVTAEHWQKSGQLKGWNDPTMIRRRK